MKRERENPEAEESSDDEIGPMPVPDVQSAKKKRKGTFQRARSFFVRIFLLTLACSLAA